MIYFFIFLDITHSAFQKWDKMSFYPYYYSVEFIFSELLCNWRVHCKIWPLSQHLGLKYRYAKTFLGMYSYIFLVLRVNS